MTGFLRHALAVSLAASLMFVLTADVRATVVQVDGTIVPVAVNPGNCVGDLQVCLNNEEGVAPPVANAIHAVIDAAQLPEIFLPNTTMPVIFKDIAEGAGFENSFGYYNVGDDPTITSNLRPIMGCGVAASAHANEVPSYAVNAEPGTTVSVDFAAELSSGRYRGGFIAFYLITPEGNPSSTNCGDFVNGGDGNSLFGHAYFTQRDYNNDGDFVHHLVYQSRITPNRFYFGFEDLFRGGDNDYEDMAMQVTGLTPPCVPGVEVCNGRDDDCDGLIDGADPSISDVGTACTCDGVAMTCEGGARQGVCRTGATACVAGGLVCQSSVGPTSETCNTLDDNCDGAVDNATVGSGVACDGPDADLCAEGVTVCVAGAMACNDATGSNVETCNGVDQDCDGRIDEMVAGLGAPCDGPDGDSCEEGVVACTGGALTCTDATATTFEQCNGVDDDCDGVIDDSPNDVGVPCSVGVGLCARSGATACVAGAPRCNATAAAPQAERCNAIDDDCDGSTDEGYRLGESCVAPGACGAGVLECAGPTSTRCSSAPGGSMSGGSAETCNGIDDDCDGTIDEGLSDLGACGTNVGECTQGRLRCLAAMPTCVGGVGPSPETCDARDNDCDAQTDEAPVDEGDRCGVDTGECSAGTELCVAGALTCSGAVGPAEELCNALDDDCDAITDETPRDGGASCGTTDEGICELGATICVSGGWVCAGAIEPSFETCNGQDDDCDGRVDEDPVGIGRVCGSSMGSCTPGITACIDGAIVCSGSSGGVPEVCNGVDDDCNSIIDDSPIDEGGTCGMGEGVCEEGMLRCIAGALQCVGGVLPGTEVCNGLDDDCDGVIDDGDLCEGGVCVAARCSLPCQVTEFGELCPSGEMCVDHYCVEDTCFGVVCAPSVDGSRNVCRDGTCIPACDAFECGAPNVCRRTDGACVGNNCIFLPYLCAEDQICVDAECVDDPCGDVSCGEREFCRAGECIGSCAGVRCGAEEICEGGVCKPLGCETGCGSGRICSSSGECVDDPCRSRGCAHGEVCDPRAGGCVDDVCRNIECPEDEICQLGECYAPSDLTPDATFDGGVRDDRRDVLAAGGGGMCSVSVETHRAMPTWLLLLPLGLGMVVIRAKRRHRRRYLTLSASLFIALSVAGCEVDPYCVANCDSGGPTIDGSVPADAHTDAPRVRRDACVFGAEEECNEEDDDCDGLIDEGIDLTRDSRHCGSCGITCERPGAQTACRDGMCEFLDCFGGFIDLNDDTEGPFEDTDGCEYRCYQSNDGVEACDEIDNDCDGRADEDFDLTGDQDNCGRCGRVCAFFRVAAASCSAGTCGFDPRTDCVPGYVDANGVQADGCEVECTPSGDELCDGLDNDCDGRIDETFALETNPMSCGRCGHVCSFPNATARCDAGICNFDPMTDCDPGYSDRDGVQLNGCEYPCTPTADPREICDGLDNDCNGRVDGPTLDSGAACNRAPGGVATGVCTDDGTMTCVGGALVCTGAVEPTRERCNGQDDDCNGAIDDAPSDVGRVCLAPVGACSAGFSVCNAGTLSCSRAVGPTSEVCNGLDDDCDGTIDESPADPTLGTTCGTDVGECSAGTWTCASGTIVCAGSVGPSLEVCNGRDDNCDGLTDNDPVDVGASCGSSVGACVSGSTACVGGVLGCTGGIPAGTETCNGIDDDCDGTTDEALVRACYSGPMGTLGGSRVCRAGTQTCIGGVFGACAGEITPTVETCDTRDEDCDGSVDENITRSCYTGAPSTNGVGICRSGLQTCNPTTGTFGATCSGQVIPGVETCDSRDEDCDGNVDEATAGGPLVRSCYGGTVGTAGIGTCREGSQTCVFGAYEAVCGGEVVDTVDRCGDSLDTDCDSLNDAAEGCMSAGSELRIDTGTGLGASHSYSVQLASGGSPIGSHVYAVWIDKRHGANTAVVYFSRSTDGGGTFGTPQALTSTSGRAVEPRIAVGRNGSNDVIHIAYQIVSGGIRRVHVTRSTNSGASFSGNTQVDAGGSTDNFKHAIATGTDGSRVVVAWEELNTGTLARRVMSRASIDSGASWGGVRLVSVNGGASSSAGKPVVAVTSTGRFVFVFRQARPDAMPAQPTFDVYANYSDERSNPLMTSTEVRLDGDTLNRRASDELRIAQDGTRVYVVWNDVSTIAGGGADIMFARTTNDAVSWSTERILDDAAMEVSSSYQPTIAIDPRTSSATDDRVFVAWVDTRDGTQIFSSRSLDSGANFSAPIRASNNAGGPVVGVNDSPAIAFGGGDSVIIAYVNDADGANTYRRVRAAVSIDGGGVWQLTDPVIDQGGGEADYPAIARATGSAPAFIGAVIAWVDFRSASRTHGDIYRARVGR